MDLVITYVDSTDVKWRQKFEETKKQYYNNTIYNEDSATSNRFTPVGNSLKFALRSIDENMRFLRNVILVIDDDTCIPEWMNLDGTNLKIVRHSEFIPNELLPTFNSHMIEAYIYRIEGLSDIFCYSNDDVVILNEVIIDHFIEDGKTAIFVDKCFSQEGTPITTEYASRSQYKNQNNWLNTNFVSERRYKMAH